MESIDQINSMRKNLYRDILRFYAKRRDTRLDQSRNSRRKWSDRRNWERFAVVSYYSSVEELMKCFNSFHIVDASTIRYGVKELGNELVCVNGTSSFKNAIWIHTNLINEILQSSGIQFEDKKILRDFLSYKRELYNLVNQ